MFAIRATTVLSASFGGAFVALIVVCVAAPVIAAAFLEEPPSYPVPTPAVVLAVCWSAFFAVAAVIVATSSRALGIVGLLVAACELGTATAIWFIRSRRGGRGGGGGGGGRRRRRSPRPTGPALPDSYWQRWEAQLSDGGAHNLGARFE